MKSQLKQMCEARILRKRFYLSGRTRVAVRSDSSQGNSYSSLSQIKKASSQDGKRLFFNFRSPSSRARAGRTLGLGALFVCLFASYADAKDLTTILQEARLNLRAKSMTANLEVSVISGKQIVSSRFALWTEGTKKAVLKSFDENPQKRISQLRLGDKLWRYQTSTDRVLPVSGSEMKNAIARSDVSFEDIVIHMLPENDVYRMLGESKLDSVSAYKISATEPGKTVPRMIFWVSADHSTLLRQERYGDDGKLEKVLETRRVRKVGNYFMPVTLAIRTVGAEPGNFTRVDLKNVQVDQNLEPALFSHVFLKQNANRVLPARLIATE